MSGFTDSYGRAWAQTTTRGHDRYASGGLILEFPAGSPLAQAQHSAEVNAPTGYQPAPEWIEKTTIYRRAADAEVETLDAFLANTATARQRRMWTDATNGQVSVAEVLPLAEALFGAERAAELLA